MEKPKRPINIIQDFIALSDLSFVDKFEFYVDKLLQTPLDFILQKIEKKTQAKIPLDMKANIAKNYKQLSTLKQIIEEERTKEHSRK